MAIRIAVIVVLVLPVILVPASYGAPFNAATVLASLVWLGIIAGVMWTYWPKSGQ